ncbi:MAG: hypothetical protein HYW24_00675 [Candidatus Aenigmarchaeota archaeon]|nr:hypothetical protein [Candidatus Aenigmarchaeota archaeon]
MPDHISYLDGITIEWEEDQPVTKEVRKQMEKDGFIKNLIDRLENNGESFAREEYEYPSINGHEKYICQVRRYTEGGYWNSPNYLIFINPDKANHPWDAIGNVYIGRGSDWLRSIIDQT